MRRLPWVTFTLIAACVLALFATARSATRADERAAAVYSRLEAAFHLWQENPYLRFDPRLLSEMPPDARNAVTIAERVAVQPPEDLDPEEVSAQQLELDELLAGVHTDLEAAKAAHPYFAHGLVVGAIEPWGLFAHMFMHAGLMHLLGNMFLLFLTGPALEDRWGRAQFAAFYLAAGLFAGVFFAALSRDQGVPLVGASGAIAGVLGAFFVRLWSTKIRFWFWVFFGIHGTFSAPTWMMLPLWFGNEVFQAFFTRTYGVSSGVAYEAHVGGFVFGAAVALAFKLTGFDRRLDDAVENAVTVRGNPAVGEALALREQGDLSGAIRKLALEVKRSPLDADAVDAHWDASVANGSAGDAAHAVLALAQRELSANAADRAAQRFIEVHAALPDYGFDPSFVVRLLPQLRALDREHALAALRWLAAGERGPLAPTLAQRAVDEARALDVRAAKQLARRFGQAELPQAMRERFEALARELEAEAPDERALDATGLDLASERTPQAAFRAHALGASDEEEAGWNAAEALGPLIDESAAAPRFSGIKVTEATPLALTDTALSLALEGGRKGQLAFAKIDAVSLAAVRGLAAKPVLLLDLLAGFRALDGGELRCVRLRSDRFDPRRLCAERDPLAALHALVAQLVAKTGAAALAGADPANPDGLRTHEDLASYEREVLEVGA